MIDIEKLKPEVIQRLKPLDPEKIILFGSYAYGTPTEESDIDLFLVKENSGSKFEVDALKRVSDLIYKYKVGFDILSATSQELNSREDYFYKTDILKNGKVLYEQNSS